MSAVTTSLIVFACVFASAFVGMGLRRALPEHHRAAESKELIRLTMTLIGTMSALVLGLLVASSKSYYDGQKEELTTAQANIMLLDRVLALYGPDAQPARGELHRVLEGAAERIWNPQPGPPMKADSVYQAVAALKPATESQRELREHASTLIFEIGKSRWLLFARQESAVARPLLIAVVFWLSINFMSFGLFATRNSTVVAALFLGAMSVAGAVYLIQEMNAPFSGLLRISDAPMRAVIDQVGR